MSGAVDPAALLDQSLIRVLGDLVDPKDEAFLRELYADFATDARDALQQMRSQLRRGEGALLAREAHRLKGSSGSIGAAGFSRRCREIEQLAREERAGLGPSLEHAERDLDATVRALDALVRESAR